MCFIADRSVCVPNLQKAPWLAFSMLLPVVLWYSLPPPGFPSGHRFSLLLPVAHIWHQPHIGPILKSLYLNLFTQLTLVCLVSLEGKWNASDFRHDGWRLWRLWYKVIAQKEHIPNICTFFLTAILNVHSVTYKSISTPHNAYLVLKYIRINPPPGCLTSMLVV